MRNSVELSPGPSLYYIGKAPSRSAERAEMAGLDSAAINPNAY